MGARSTVPLNGFYLARAKKAQASSHLSRSTDIFWNVCCNVDSFSSHAVGNGDNVVERPATAVCLLHRPFISADRLAKALFGCKDSDRHRAWHCIAAAGSLYHPPVPLHFRPPLDKLRAALRHPRMCSCRQCGRLPRGYEGPFRNSLTTAKWALLRPATANKRMFILAIKATGNLDELARRVRLRRTDANRICAGEWGRMGRMGLM